MTPKEELALAFAFLLAKEGHEPVDHVLLRYGYPALAMRVVSSPFWEDLKRRELVA